MSEETPIAPVTTEEAPATEAAEAAPVVVAAPAKPDKGGFYWGTGRRKAAIARVRIRPGTGKFLINGREVDNYFTEERDQSDARSAAKLTNTSDKLDIFVNAHGGGYMGQAGAVLLGLARALIKYDPSLEAPIRAEGMLTRDSRRVERKKYGQPGARKRFQFSKR